MPAPRKYDIPAETRQAKSRCVAKRKRGELPTPEELQGEREYQFQWSRHNIQSVMLSQARKRAKSKGQTFALAPEDITVPEECPCCGVTMVRGAENIRTSPSLDRIDNDRPYEVGNVIVICTRCNHIKNDATPEELHRIAYFVQGLLIDSQ